MRARQTREEETNARGGYCPTVLLSPFLPALLSREPFAGRSRPPAPLLPGAEAVVIGLRVHQRRWGGLWTIGDWIENGHTGQAKSKGRVPEPLLIQCTGAEKAE